jgi:hypothetical protein
MKNKRKMDGLITKGLNKNIALLLYWDYLTEEEKGNLSIEQCKWLCEHISINNPKNIEALLFIQKKSETFSDYQWLWENTPIGNPNKNKILSLLKEKAKTFDDFQYLVKNIFSDDREIIKRRMRMNRIESKELSKSIS